MSDNFVLPKTSSFQIIHTTTELLVQHCNPPVSADVATIVSKLISSYLLYCSWHTYWQPDLKTPLAELRLFAEAKPNHPEWLEHIQQWTLLVHPSSLVTLQQAPNSPAAIAQQQTQDNASSLVTAMQPLQTFAYNKAILQVIEHYLNHKNTIDATLNCVLTPMIVQELNVRFNVSAPAAAPVPHPLEQLRAFKGAEAAPKAEPKTEKAATTTQTPLFSPQDLQAFANKATGQDHEAQKIRRLISDLQAAGHLRDFIQTPPGTELAHRLGILRQRFPHFSEVIDFIEAHLRLQACGADNHKAYFPPILLRAAPGVGKSRFARELAATLSLPFYNRDLSITSEAFIITGHDPGWKGAKPGIIFDALAQSTVINPLICFDELDKAVASSGYRSPANALYTLLEPHSAAKFTDEYLPLPLNARHINWLFTANHDAIPEPILSRLEVFDIKNPTPAQLETIAQSVWDDILRDELPSGHPFGATLTPEVLPIMSTISPRIMRKLLTYACTVALQSGRSELSVADVQQACLRYQPPAPSRSIGFLSAS